MKPMQTRFFVAVTLLAILCAAACGCSDSEASNTNQPEEPPFTAEFSTMTLVRQCGAWCLPEVGTWANLVISREDDGQYSLEGRRYAVMTSPEDCSAMLETPTDLPAGSCIGLEPQAGTASDATVAELGALAAAVPARQCEVDPDRACDPNMIATVGVDGVAETGFCCGTTAPGFGAAFSTLIDRLDAIEVE